MTGIATGAGAAGCKVTGPAARLGVLRLRSVHDGRESRDIPRYIANLLIFLGLLGTFFGLATQRCRPVVDTIRSLQPTEGEEGDGRLRPPL